MNACMNSWMWMSLTGTPTGYVLYNNHLFYWLYIERSLRWDFIETVRVGNLITSARWTENDHCECNKALTCLLEKTTWDFPPCFELEKRQVKNPPVSPTQSPMWSHSIPHLCFVLSCKFICISHRSGLKTIPSLWPPRTLTSLWWSFVIYFRSGPTSEKIIDVRLIPLIGKSL